MFGFFRKKSKPEAAQLQNAVDTVKAQLRLSHRMACESGLSLAYWLAAERAAGDGIMDLYEEYSRLSEEHATRHDDLEAVHGEHTQS